MQKEKQRAALRIVLTYTLVASLWIVFSDRLLGLIFVGAKDLVLYSMVKGLAFVLVTSLLLYTLVRRELLHLQEAEQALLDSREALQASQERLERILETVPSGIVIVRRDEKIGYANSSAEEILGLTWQDLSRRTYNDPGWKIMDLEGRPIQDDELPFRQVMRTGESVFGIEQGIELPSGLRRILRINAAPLRDATGTQVGIVASLHDVTAEKENEAALREGEERYRRQAERLAALREVDGAINANLPLPVILELLLQKILEQLPIIAASVARYRGPGVLEVLAERGFQQVFSGDPMLTLPDGQETPPYRRSQVERNGEFFEETMCIPLVSKGHLEGMLEVFYHQSLWPSLEAMNFLETMAGLASIAIDHATLYRGLERSNRELTSAYDATLQGWAKALELRDQETEGHSRRVTELTLRLAAAMGISDAELVHVRRGALLHDIGKLGVPDSILLKPGTLSEEERQVIQRHPDDAYRMLSSIPYLAPALDIPHFHHERWDGSGYPRGLQGEAIPLAARIFALVDVWDALSSDRPYRPAWPEEKIWAYVQAERGRMFDPQVVDMFVEMMTPV
jgi:PAS domain S-box-containing protein/putative nucleotidyltransferase with HDIG domain